MHSCFRKPLSVSRAPERKFRHLLRLLALDLIARRAADRWGSAMTPLSRSIGCCVSGWPAGLKRAAPRSIEVNESYLAPTAPVATRALPPQAAYAQHS